jgi:calcineurin-like phosphoesterase family protein
MTMMRATSERWRRFVHGGAGVMAALAVAMCTDNTGPTADRPQLFVTPTGLTTSNPPEVFVGAGDIATCSNYNNDEATAALLDNIAGTVFVLGDNVYPNGTNSEYSNCYQPTWGRHKARTKPVPGNHDYNTSGGAGYFNYFGSAAGTPGQGYYSFDLGQWHIIALNSEISKTASSPQMQWLLADLAAHPNLCTLAYWHEPLWSSDSDSGSGGVLYSSVRPLWDTLYAYGADLVLNGHRHNYERIAPMKPNATGDPAFGIRTMVAGMGGIGGSSLTNVFPLSEARNGNTFGVLKLYLYDDSYAWKFVPVAGKTYTDSGSTACHPRPGSQPPVATALGFKVQPTDTTAGSPITPAVQVEIRDQFGVRLTSATNAVTLALGTNPGGSTLSGTTTVAAVNGVATFNGLSLDQTGSGYRLAATSAGLTDATSNSFNVTSTLVATALSFVVQPSTTGVGAAITPAVQVEIRDQFGTRLSSATNQVSLSLGTNPGGSTLSGATTVDAVDGVATFSGLTLDQVGSGYTLAATSAGLTAATSAAFDVTATTPPPTEITHTLLTSGVNLVNLNTHTTATISPAPNTLVTIALLSHRSTATISPTVTGGGMASWELVASVDFDTLSLPHRRLSIYRAMSAAPGSGPITFQFTNQVSNLEWMVSQWDGVETSGVNGAGAIGQSGSNRADANNGLSVTLGALGQPANVAFGAFGVNAQVPAIAPGVGFTEIDEQPAAEGTRGDLQTEWAVNRSVIGASWTNLKAGALGVEIKARTQP